MNWEFLTSSQPFSLRKEGGGFLNGLIGTAIMVGIAARRLGPLGILGGRLPGGVRQEELAGQAHPLLLRRDDRRALDLRRTVRLHGAGGPVRLRRLMGAAALAIIMMPIIVRSTEEMLKLVPPELKDASYAWARPSGRPSPR